MDKWQTLYQRVINLRSAARRVYAGDRTNKHAAGSLDACNKVIDMIESLFDGEMCDAFRCEMRITTTIKKCEKCLRVVAVETKEHD